MQVCTHFAYVCADKCDGVKIRSRVSRLASATSGREKSERRACAFARQGAPSPESKFAIFRARGLRALQLIVKHEPLELLLLLL